MRPSLILFLFCTSFAVSAQLSLERQLTNRMEKGKWKSAEESLRKAIRKDSLNPEARYLFSTFYFEPQNPSRNIDSAYYYIQASIEDFSVLPQKEKDRLKRIPFDSITLLNYRKKIDSVAFDYAKKVNTENAYLEFLSKYPYALQQKAAIELRNEVAFVEALKLNTYKSFLDYLSKYPDSQRAPEAKLKYDKLLFEDKTHEGRLKEFELFYKEYPTSPYHEEAEKHIFEITTATGRPNDFATFIKNYPIGSFRIRAEAILYHLSKEEELTGVNLVLNDSLKQAQHSEQGYWVPVLRNGKFGFIDNKGAETVSPQFENILPDYLCGNIKTDYLVVNGGVIARSGRWIVQGSVLEATDAGSGFLKVNSGNCIQAVHKSGYVLPGPCFVDIKVISHNFVAVKDHLKWGLMTLTGRWLLEPVYEDVIAVDDLVVLVKNGKKMIVTLDEVAGLADKHPLPTLHVFDDVQRLAIGIYLVKNGSLEGTINASLEFTVPLNRQQISRVQQGLMLKRDQKYLLEGISRPLANREFRKVQFYGNWLKLQEENNLQLYQLHEKRVANDKLDSLWFENELAFAWKHDSLIVYLKSGKSIEFVSGTKVIFIKSADSTAYFFAPEKKLKSVFETKTGKKLFSFDFDEIEYIGHGVFLTTSNSKKGLLNDKGKIVLPLEYMAIISSGHDMVSLLKDKKFGMFHLKSKKLLKPVYERNVLPFSSQYLVVYKEGAYGFIAWDAKPLSKFEFNEVQPWSDSTALVKKNFQWMIYSIRTQRYLMEKIKDYRFVSNLPGEKVLIVHQDLQYGILSNRRGEVIPANFSDIINVGSEEEPMYFVEKNVEEASIYVVIYYDKNGKLLRKQVYEEEEYEKIYCTEK